jgi:hypothetical protein
MPVRRRKKSSSPEDARWSEGFGGQSISGATTNITSDDLLHKVFPPHIAATLKAGKKVCVCASCIALVT